MYRRYILSGIHSFIHSSFIQVKWWNKGLLVYKCLSECGLLSRLWEKCNFPQIELLLVLSLFCVARHSERWKGQTNLSFEIRTLLPFCLLSQNINIFLLTLHCFHSILTAKTIDKNLTRLRCETQINIGCSFCGLREESSVFIILCSDKEYRAVESLRVWGDDLPKTHYSVYEGSLCSSDGQKDIQLNSN